ncbi:hypothetical protein [Sandaracinus amylolyticus]|uniref:BNR repeat domain protein n=1 Tax=Sandaracinus amylolyticus TaxID=927083 RepID=A0A0F6YJF6_9BACT|nr:hypothetical protein [Sandaracinus amylolyticus]AKF06963.1 hypothetical protein DB32_004112 [Sandaracinus amylolyticus]
MIRAPRPQTADDDELPGLPDIAGDDEPAGDLGLGLADDIDEGDEGDETVGLDVSTGVEGEEDFLDALDDDDADESWDAAEEPLTEDPELDEGEEGGWTEGSEAAEAPGWDADLDDADLDEEREPSLVRDAGEEGVEERLDALDDDDAPVGLPASTPSREDELADDLELEGEGEIDALPGADERPEHPALSLPRMPATSRWLGPDDDAILAIGGGLAGGRTLYRIEGDEVSEIDAIGLDGDEPTSLVRTASGALLVGLQLGGVARSTDGERFEPVEALRRGEATSVGAFHLLAEPHAGGVRLWGLTRGGALVRSDDEGATWSRPLIPGAVLAVGHDVEGGVVGVLGARGGAMRLIRTRDGGRSWRNVAGPTIAGLPDEHEIFVAALGPIVVLTTDVPGLAPYVTRDDGQRWEVLDALRDAGAIALAAEPSGAALYAGVLAEGTDRGLVVRAAIATGERPSIVVDLEEVRAKHHVTGAGDPEGDQRVHALVVERRDEETTLWIGSGIGLVRTRVKIA